MEGGCIRRLKVLLPLTRDTIHWHTGCIQWFQRLAMHYRAILFTELRETLLTCFRPYRTCISRDESKTRPENWKSWFFSLGTVSLSRSHHNFHFWGDNYVGLPFLSVILRRELKWDSALTQNNVWCNRRPPSWMKSISFPESSLPLSSGETGNKDVWDTAIHLTCAVTPEVQ